MFEILGCEAMARKSSHDKCCRNMTVYFDNNYDEELAERQQLTECDQQQSMILTPRPHCSRSAAPYTSASFNLFDLVTHFPPIQLCNVVSEQHRTERSNVFGHRNLAG